MRLWTLHPQYLDSRGLVAAWREALLAQKVLAGETRGYRNHPQLERFRRATDPKAAIGAYLTGLAAEGARRGYRFDGTKIRAPGCAATILATRGQVQFEWSHLMAKLAVRDEARLRQHASVRLPAVHPLFLVEEGPIEEWERAAGQDERIRSA